MPFLVKTSGISYNPSSFITTLDGISKELIQINTTQNGVDYITWKKGANFSKVLFLDDELVHLAPTDLKKAGTIFEFQSAAKYRVTVIGRGGDGGAGGENWSLLYSGGQGGGGGTGGCISFEIDLTSGVWGYLDFAFVNAISSVNPTVCTNSIRVRYILYPDTLGGEELSSYLVTPGNNGNKGEDADYDNWDPDGGAGGQGGKVYWFRDYNFSVLNELTYCAGYNGGEGGSGYDSRRPIDKGKGHGGEAPPMINVYDPLTIDAPMQLSTIDNAHQRPSDYYTTNIDNPNAITGYDISHIALGNAGAGGWQTIEYGDYSAGAGGKGGIVVEIIS